jgi:molybdopterin/thiamine biosynthesis adenylyltransferase
MRRVLVIGAGGLGGPAALGLAAGGVRAITLVDDDLVEASNLGRQCLFGDADVGRPKAQVLAEALRRRFPGVSVDPVRGQFDRDTAAALVDAHDTVLDGSDNFPTRFLANDTCCAGRKTLVHGAALRWLGQVMRIEPGQSPCLRCVFEGEPPTGAAPTCAEAGVAAPLVGLVGAWMAEAALAGVGAPWASSMRTIDGWAGRERWVPLGRDPECTACGHIV